MYAYLEEYYHTEYSTQPNIITAIIEENILHYYKTSLLPCSAGTALSSAASDPPVDVIPIRIPY